MSKEILLMKYHPAKKEVSFQRFASGKEVLIKNDSRLSKYMNNRGKFVLQDHGNGFFDDIAEAFDGEKTVHIEVVTTRMDYEDFEQMYETYNKSGNVKITATLSSELPNMEYTYQVVKEYGEKSITILKKHKIECWNINTSVESVKKSVKEFSAEIQEKIDDIDSKITSMSDNNVDLFFAGGYSTGKSKLINAILGYRILPEKITSETARLFCVKSPQKDKVVKIIFHIRHARAELLWDEKIKSFHFGEAPGEDDTRKSIQEIINNHSSKPKHEQIYMILKTLNDQKSAEVDICIEVYFPIPIDNNKVQFTIYDTPGTDSNRDEHEIVLQKALYAQEHAIIIFVSTPDKVEGKGNNALLSYLKNAEEKESKTSIDIARSLFVMNKADTVDADDRKSLQNAQIKNNDANFSFNLSNKKLFFVSALCAYSAKAVENNVAEEIDHIRISDDYGRIQRPESGRYYMQNHIATSDYATHRLITRCNEKLNDYEKVDNKTGVFRVCSGIYALEAEIIDFGEKYASAVNAFVIIDSIDKAIVALNKTANSLRHKNQDDINKSNEARTELQETINKGIQDARERSEPDKDELLPELIRVELHLNSDYLNAEIKDRVARYIDKLLKHWFFGKLGKIKYQESHKKKISQYITSVLSDYTHKFLEDRQRILEKIRDDFINGVRNIIQSNGNISDNAKSYVLEIRPPKIIDTNSLIEFGGIYDSNARVDKFLWVNTRHIDKNGFLADSDHKLTKILTEIVDDFTEDFRSTQSSIINAIETEFTQNIEKYSLLMQAMSEDKEAMEQLGEKINSAETELISCQNELNKLIWNEK
jgi:hypothetical protein